MRSGSSSRIIGRFVGIWHDLEPVGVRELTGLGVRGTGHAGELVVELEVVLQRDGREGLVLLLDPHALLRLHRLVQAVGPTAWLGEWLDDAGLERPILVGHSLGGLISAQLAALQPERLDSLVLVDPAGMPTGRPLPLEPLALANALSAVRPRFFALLVADALRWGPDAGASRRPLRARHRRATGSRLDPHADARRLGRARRS